MLVFAEHIQAVGKRPVLNAILVALFAGGTEGAGSAAQEKELPV